MRDLGGAQPRPSRSLRCDISVAFTENADGDHLADIIKGVLLKSPRISYLAKRLCGLLLKPTRPFLSDIMPLFKVNATKISVACGLGGFGRDGRNPLPGKIAIASR